jgi:hypothetical protein
LAGTKRKVKNIRKFAEEIGEFQEAARDKHEADRLIHDFCFGI